MSLVGNVVLNADREQHYYSAGHNQNMETELSRGGSTLVPSSAHSGDENYEQHEKRTESEEQLHRDEEVRHLARQLSRQSTTLSLSDNPFSENKNPKLDPSSPEFNARAWAKSILQLHSRDEKVYPLRTAGIAYKNLNVHGFGTDTDFQKTVSNMPLQAYKLAKQLLGNKGRKINILREFDGVVRSGEMCVVLGPPGSGCSTFLKTISGETHGFFVDPESHLNYQGISSKMMQKDFRGEAIYTAEVDVHFPQLTVGQTLSFAAEARAARHPPGGVSRKVYAEHARDVIMATFGISHTINTRVGNDFVRGVSGGERKRVTIAEAALSNAPLQCWDNSTRGLDSANAIEFCKTLRMSTDLMGATAFVAIYQAPQAAYDCFDKVVVIYEGRQIFFGKCDEAKKFFVDMGFDCPERQTTPDFLTSLTSPAERKAREGFENKVPRTPDEFEQVWKSSQAYKDLMLEIEEFDKEFPIGGESLEAFKHSRRMQQAKSQRSTSPYTLSYNQQIQLCLRRGFWRLAADPSLTLTQIFGNSAFALIIGSVFYNLAPTSDSFFQRGALLFFAILINAFGSALEILTLYAQRPIVEKHSRYALYHPSAEAYASMLTDLPYKISNALVFNLILYFMTNLRREPGAFFFLLLISFILTLCMSMIFRTIASVSRTLSQALAPAAILILALVIYTGFAIPVRNMLSWIRWFNYIDPIGYAFESLMVNEFYNRNFTCTTFLPSGTGYEDITGVNRVCQAVGGVPGADYIDGGTYIATAYNYLHSHKWRNLGIIIAETIFFLLCYLAATEVISAKKSKGEVLVFRRGHTPKAFKDSKASSDDIEAAVKGEKSAITPEKEAYTEAIIQRQTAIFHWQDVCYDIKIKGEERRILDHVDGWVKPGQLTALMGVSGAGKTTLLDVLATRVTMGVVTGEMLVDGRQRDASFQRKTGYVQQQDLHLETSTVREALEFSALLRQPAHVPRKEKIAYVSEVIKLLEMEAYADAVVGVPGEGLNVEQRKRLTIGVELAAKPQLLLFLDEPTSGLDSQTSWSIADLMEKLTKNGQAILCTIHQPSAMLFQRFDRLLFLAKGGKTVYFGPVGENSKILTKYFESNGGHPCPEGENPAEWMLNVIGAAPGSSTEIDWHKTWLDSPERQAVRQELAELKAKRPQETQPSTNEHDKASYRPFAAPMTVQMAEVTKRVFQQYWRTPSYIYSKLALCICSALFIGFSFFKSPLSQQGLQNQMFAIFMLFTIFGQLVQQIMPHFVTQRALYEVRERPSKAYSWIAFMFSNLVVEIPYAFLCAIIIYCAWYYPIGLDKNAIPSETVTERGALMFLFILQFMLFTTSFATMVIAYVQRAIDTAETAGNIANLMFSLCLVFCGVLAGPSTFPRFWIFMYRVSPFTYLVDGMLSTGLADQRVTCSDIEIRTIEPPAGETCINYLSTFMNNNGGGYLLDEQATSNCQFCALSSTNTFLKMVNSNYDLRWRNFGILWVFILFNMFAAFFWYWLGRVPKNKERTKKEKKAKTVKQEP